MATPKPGEIRCPTCHRSTPPAAFCTQCGSAIPADARARPRGMDRDELQDRIRARRSGGDPYRRGGSSDQGYERFEPDPTDANVRRAPGQQEPRTDHFDESAAAAARDAERAEGPRPDLTRDHDDWAPAAGAAAAGGYAGAASAEPSIDQPPRAEPPAYEPPAAPAETHEPQYAPEYYDDEAGAYPYEYDEWEERQPRSSGAGAFAILGFLALGVLALLGGAVLAGVFSDDPGTALESPTPSLSASLAPVVSAAPSTAPSVAASAEPAASDAPPSTGEPVVFDDGAVFEVQACATNEMSFSGCAQQAEFVSGGSFFAWIGFSGAGGDDTLLLVLRQDGAAVADSEFVLGNQPFGCTSDCTGYARQGFTGLPPGEYTVELLRNGEPAHAISIGVD
jgi:hypothetical protein